MRGDDLRCDDGHAFGSATAKHAGGGVGRRPLRNELAESFEQLGALRSNVRRRDAADRSILFDDVDDADVGERRDGQAGDLLQGSRVVEIGCQHGAGIREEREALHGRPRFGDFVRERGSSRRVGPRQVHG